MHGTSAQQYDKARGTRTERGYDNKWGRIRLAKLKKNPLCEDCQREGRTKLAKEVHHIKPIAEGGGHEDENLRSLCKPCHVKYRGQKGDRPAATIVCGPPGSGKTTYVMNKRRPGDLIVDLDMIWQALTNLPPYEKPAGLLPFVLEAREAVLRRLEQPSDIYRAWVVIGLPKREDREALAQRLQASVKVLDVPVGECVRRIAGDDRRGDKAELWRPHIERWWSEYTA